jgi:hypothetical protein
MGVFDVLYAVFLNHGEAIPLFFLSSLYCRERQISFEGQKKQKPSSIPRCLRLRASSHQKTVIAAFACRPVGREASELESLWGMTPRLPAGRQKQMLVSACLNATASVF